MLLLNWVCCLQKLSSLYIDGVRFLEFDVRARPRSVTCVHKTLTPRMKHTRVPRTVRRDIWRLAMETLSIPSLHSFWSRIRNQIKSRIENRKKTNGPNRKSNGLKYKKIHIPCATLDYYLGWLMWCKVYISYEPYEEIQWADFPIFDRTSQLCVKFVPA